MGHALCPFTFTLKTRTHGATLRATWKLHHVSTLEIVARNVTCICCRSRIGSYFCNVMRNCFTVCPSSATFRATSWRNFACNDASFVRAFNQINQGHKFYSFFYFQKAYRSWKDKINELGFYSGFAFDAVIAMALALNKSAEVLASGNKSLDEFTYKDKEMAQIFKRALSSVKFLGFSVKTWVEVLLAHLQPGKCPRSFYRW